MGIYVPAEARFRRFARYGARESSYLYASLSVAVIYRAIRSDRHYTWKDVRDAATAFGEGLCNLWDWQRQEVLAIYAPNDIDVGPLIYGVFFAGGIVSPANPAYSPDELTFQLKNSGAKAIATIGPEQVPARPADSFVQVSASLSPDLFDGMRQHLAHPKR